MTLKSVYSCYVDGRAKERIENLNGAFEVHGIKSLEAYEVVLGKPEFVDAVDDGCVVSASISPER